ncbi:hypothetical protein PMAYCL1PPCAC_26006 [Pristionchus mayeri]|uniref:Uncharacterized protein n=1 Tax=Pristionchus mayeri TaxID=1317129 RepID=A0AAN5D3P7_9BILA|nr:hypothetical protein PMAYCL1PPCAC_26006 [Pristionchus mayeri]
MQSRTSLHFIVDPLVWNARFGGVVTVKVEGLVAVQGEGGVSDLQCIQIGNHHMMFVFGHINSRHSLRDPAIGTARECTRVG